VKGGGGGGLPYQTELQKGSVEAAERGIFSLRRLAESAGHSLCVAVCCSVL